MITPIRGRKLNVGRSARKEPLMKLKDDNPDKGTETN